MKPILYVLLLVLGVCSSFSLNAQEFTYNWHGVFNSEEYSHVRSVFDQEDNIIVYGAFIGLTDLDPSAGIQYVGDNDGQLRYFISKISATGELIWAKTFSTSGGISDYTIAQVEVGAQNEIYFAGSFRNGVDFGDNGGQWNFFSEGTGYSGYLAKLDEMGEVKFVVPFYTTPTSTFIPSDFRINSLEVISGKIVMGGYFRGKVDLDPGIDTLIVTSPINQDSYPINSFVISLNESGDLQEVVTLSGSGNNFIMSTSLNDHGELICLGMFSDSLFLSHNGTGDTLVTMQPSGEKNFVFKLSNTGDINWILEPLWKLKSGKLTHRSNNEIYLSGSFAGGIWLEDSVFNYDSYYVGGEYYNGGPLSGVGGVVLSLDEFCHLKWGRVFRSSDFSEITDIDLLKDGNIILAGEFSDSVFFQREFVTIVQEQESALITLSPEGDFLGINAFGLPHMKLLSVDYQNGSLICGGQISAHPDLQGNTNADLNFDGEQIPMWDFESLHAGLVVHYGISFFSNGSDVNIFPNPCFGELTIEIMEPSDLEEIVLLDEVGRIVVHFQITSVKNTYHLDSLHSGIYYLSFRGKIYKIMVI